VARAKGISFSILVLVALTALPSSAAATIVIGSDLSGAAGTQGPQRCDPAPAPCTDLLGGVHSGNLYPATSPSDGTIISFGTKLAAAATLSYRVGTPESPSTSAGRATGAATGPSASYPGAGTFTTPASVRVSAGDEIGFDSSNNTAYGNCSNHGYFYLYNPPLLNGEALRAASANSTCELLVQAIVVPDSVFDFTKLKLFPAKGTATYKLDLPGPGKVSLSSPGLKKVKATASKAGDFNLKLTPTSATRSKLARSGQAKLKISVTFSPTGGTPSTEKRTVKLIQR